MRSHHSHGTGQIELRITGDSVNVTAEVTDEGSSFERQVRNDDGLHGVGGKGLFIVAQIAENWGVHEGTTHVWCQIAIDTPRQAGGPDVGSRSDRVVRPRPLKRGARMTETVHEDNDTPAAGDDDVKRMDADTPHAPEGEAAEDQGVGVNPTDSSDTDENNDPKSGGTPVHAAPSQDSPHS